MHNNPKDWITQLNILFVDTETQVRPLTNFHVEIYMILHAVAELVRNVS